MDQARTEEQSAETELLELFPDNREIRTALSQRKMKMVMFIIDRECEWENPENDILNVCDSSEPIDLLFEKARRIRRIKELREIIFN